MLSSGVFQVVVMVLSGCGLSEQESCTEGSVRIVDSNGMESLEGRVEFCHNNEWGTVCDDSWGLEDAMVVCRQLDLNYVCVTQGHDTPDGSGPIWLDDLQCTGSETQLGDCPANNVAHNCEHEEDGGVVCSRESTHSNDCLTNGAIRLVGGSDTLGRVEVCHFNLWGTVCDDQWDDTDAGVACRQLGYSADGATARGFGFRNGCERIWLDELECTGSETRLIDCPANPVSEHDCNHLEDAGVICISNNAHSVSSVPLPTTQSLSTQSSTHANGDILSTNTLPMPTTGSANTPAETAVAVGVVVAIVSIALLIAAAIAGYFIVRRVRRHNTAPSIQSSNTTSKTIL